MTKGVPFVQITMLFMQTTFKYCAKYTIMHLLEEKEISIMYIQGGILYDLVFSSVWHF